MSDPANFPGRVNERRRSALDRIEAQLASGVKPDRFGGLTYLTTDDRSRLNGEADLLGLRIKASEVVRGIRTKKTPKALWSEARRAWRRGRID